MDDDPVPDPPTLSAVPSPPQRTAAPVPGYGQYQVAPRHRCRPPAGAAAFGGAASLPQTPRKRVSPLVLAVVIAVVVVGVALGSFVLAHSIRTPEAEVQRYLDYGDRGAWLYPHCDRC